MEKKSKKRRPGRPAGRVLSESLVSVRVPQALRDELEKLAKADSRSLANFVRLVLEQEVKRRRKNA